VRATAHSLPAHLTCYLLSRFRTSRASVTAPRGAETVHREVAKATEGADGTDGERQARGGVLDAEELGELEREDARAHHGILPLRTNRHSSRT
jgi:hypothetical protein